MQFSVCGCVKQLPIRTKIDRTNRKSFDALIFNCRYFHRTRKKAKKAWNKSEENVTKKPTMPWPLKRGENLQIKLHVNWKSRIQFIGYSLNVYAKVIEFKFIWWKRTFRLLRIDWAQKENDKRKSETTEWVIWCNREVVRKSWFTTAIRVDRFASRTCSPIKMFSSVYDEIKFERTEHSQTVTCISLAVQ